MYKPTFLFVLLMFCFGNSFSQNIVQNPSWEIYSTLPTNQDQVYKATGWESLITNADYMFNGSFDGWTPQNGGAYEGEGYVGFGGYPWTPDYSEAVGGYLETSMVGGEDYTISVALQVTNSGSDSGDFSSTCMGFSLFGFSFYVEDEFFPGHLNDVGGSALLWTSEPVTNTEWQIYTGCFTAPYNINFIGLSLAPDVACYQYIFVDMLEIMPAEGSILGEDIAICDGSDFVVEEPIVDAFEWNTGQTEGDFIISDPGTYWLNYTLGSCVLSDTIEVLLANFDDFTLGPDSVICEGEGLILGTDFVADSYVWQDGSTDDEFLVTTSGIYELTITLSENCVISDEVMVDVEPVPFLELGEDILACLGDSVFLNVGLEDATYEWNDGSEEATILVTEEGTYSVVLDLNGCSTVDEVTIQFRDFPLTFLPSDSIICMNDTLILNVSSPASTYEWSTGSSDPSILVSEGGLIEVEVSNPCGTILQRININEVECGCEIFIPTAFSRNEDGLNENFKVYTECTFESFHLRIFNRMGQILFESFHSDDVWSGMYKNEIQPAGMYNYILDYQELDHENTERILGHVVLIR